MNEDLIYQRILALLGVILRALSLSVGTWLASHGYVSLATWTEIITSLGVLALLIAPIVYSFVKQWFLVKFKALALTPTETNQLIVTANELPADTSINEVKQVFRDTTGVKKI